MDPELAPAREASKSRGKRPLNGLASGQVVAVATGATIQDGSQKYTLPASNVAGVPETQTIEISVDVVAPGVTALANAAEAAQSRPAIPPSPTSSPTSAAT